MSAWNLDWLSIQADYGQQTVASCSKVKLKTLTVLTGTYPCNVGPTWQIFVRRVAHSLAQQGVKVSIVTPLAVHRAWRGKDPVLDTEMVAGGEPIQVWRPRYLSFSNKRVGLWRTYPLTYRNFLRAARKIVRQSAAPTHPDALYGHFLYPAGAAVVTLGRELKIPSFAAVGEGQLNTIQFVGEKRARQDLADATAFIPNSSELAQLLQSQLRIPAGRIGVFPNGVDLSIFFPRDKQQSRARFKLPPEKFLVCCVSRFDPDKGVQRVAEAIDGLDGVGGVFAGWGPDAPHASNICFQERVAYEEIPELLSACDVFALPTLYEGCCNAILEAMACGLPIISSEGSFNDDILRPEYAIRLNPLDTQGLRAAVQQLQVDVALRKQMGGEAQKAALRFGVASRAKRVIEFIEGYLDHQS